MEVAVTPDGRYAVSGSGDRTLRVWELETGLSPIIFHGDDLLALLFHVDVPPHATALVVESSLDQLIPVEFLADLVLELRDANGALVLAIVLEVQREKDPDKEYSWPVYVTVLRAKKRCPTMVLVVAPDAEVAAWAAQPIDLGLGLGTIRPVVLGPASVPEVTDPAVAERETELAVLSAVAHGNKPNGLAVVQAALVALVRLDREHAAVYFQIIWNALREPMQRALEALVMERQAEGETKFPPFVQRIFEQGIHEGEMKGRLEGELEGELKGRRDTLLRLLARVGITLTEDEIARVRACDDPALLDRWVDNVLGAKTASDVFF
jgi:hypothetical protein